jgi:sugar phosphate isomerase/epimerase
MRFGVCAGMEMGAFAARAAYDYMEWSVPNLLCPQESEAAFEATCEGLGASALPYEVANGFVPRELKITGPAVDAAALEAYVQIVMERARRLGLEHIVFGSGSARQIPDGFDHKRAYEQLVGFCCMVGPIAGAHGITVVVEPLNKADCNVLNTMDACAGLVNDVAHPAIRLLVDSYHMMRDGDPIASIVKHGHLLRHVHIATVPNRYAPGAEACDFAAFFDALAAVRYDGRISIEGTIPNPETELAAAIAMMRDQV